MKLSEQRINKIIDILDKTYPEAKTALKFSSPFEFLVAAILSAQCTDARVNIVTSELFAKYTTIDDFRAIPEDLLISYIKPCGLYKNKAKSIISCANIIYKRFNSKIPDNEDDLLSLPGIGRKIANVLLATLFSIPAFPVDTHVFRVSRRIGLSSAKNPDGVERDLRIVFPEDKWIALHHQLIFHGRQVCVARKPKCDICKINKYCSKNNI